MKDFVEVVGKIIEIGGLIGLVVAMVVGLIGWLGKRALDTVLKAKLDKHKSDLERENAAEMLAAKNRFDKGLAEYKQELEAVAKSDDRIRSEVLAWANPILDAVNGLESRLRNILTTKGYRALDSSFSDPEWSVTHDYFLDSTLFLFGQYFCWTQMLRQEMSFELFRSQKEMKEFFAKVDGVSGKLSDYPPHFGEKEEEYKGTGNDAQVFRLQQRAIGETLATRRGERRACRSYASFLTKLPEQNFQCVFDPVRKLVDKVKPEEKRWQRLLDAHATLIELQAECNRLLQLPGH